MSEKIYFNTASCGLLSQDSVAATNVLYEGMLTNASKAVEPLRDHGMENIRNMVASFIDAQSSQVALIPNFSWGLNAIVQSLKGNERVLLYKNDYPSLTTPFQINQFDITWLDDKDGFLIDTEELKNIIIAARIDLLVISHVQWLSGFKIDLDDIVIFCRSHNVLFIVDATQSLGAVRVSVTKQPIDVLISSNYKWMNGGFGTGIMYVSEGFMNRYPPVVGGSSSYQTYGDMSTYVASVKNFEPGHINMHGLLILEQALLYKLQLGIENIEHHNKGLIRFMLEHIDSSLLLGPATTTLRSSIIVLKDPGNLYAHLTTNGIIAIKRGNNIRIGVHFYNTKDEAVRFLDILNSGLHLL